MPTLRHLRFRALIEGRITPAQFRREMDPQRVASIKPPPGGGGVGTRR